MKKINNCKLCGNKDLRFLFKEFDKNHGISGKFNLYKCENCKIIFLNPQPSYKELEKHYPKKKYYSLKNIETYEKSRKTRLKLFLYNLYFNEKKNKPLQKVLFSLIKYKVRGAKILPKRKLLDIGSGSGQFIYDMKHFGMEVYGIEPGEFNETDAKDKELNILKLDLIQAKYPSNYFNIITINHVLEHVDNPIKIIKEIRRILKKKGDLIIGVPNYNSLAYALFKKNWYQLDAPRHLFNFSDTTLVKILEKEGFSIEKIRYNSRPSQFVISLLFALNIKSRDRMIISFLEILFLPLTWLVNLLRVGDQIEIWCVKK